MKKKLKILSFLTVIFLSLCISGSVFAAGGNGSGGGGGNGEGNGEPLALLSSTPIDGATDVLVSTPIILEFNKNVANAEVRDVNLAAISLYKAGAPIAAEVIAVDDQVNPEQKNFLSVTPSATLEAGTEYSVKIAGTLTAKNGTTFGSEKTITFKTAGTTPTVQAKTTEPKVEENQSKTGGAHPFTYVIIGIACVVAVVAVFIVLKKKKS